MTKIEKVRISDQEKLTKSEESLLELVLGNPRCKKTNEENSTSWIIVAFIITIIFIALLYFWSCGYCSSYVSSSSGRGFLFALIFFILIFIIIAFIGRNNEEDED